MFRLAVLAFLFVFALVNIVDFSSWRGIAWLVAIIVIGLAILFSFVSEPAFLRRTPLDV